MFNFDPEIVIIQDFSKFNFKQHIGTEVRVTFIKDGILDFVDGNLVDSNYHAHIRIAAYNGFIKVPINSITSLKLVITKVIKMVNKEYKTLHRRTEADVKLSDDQIGESK